MCRIIGLIAAILILLLAGNAHAYRPYYVSECEQTRMGEHVCFWDDTLDGPVHTNSLICLRGHCLIMDTIYLTWGPYYWDSTVVFLVPPVFNAPAVLVPDSADNLRIPAQAQGHYYSTPGKSYRIYLRGDSLTICPWWTGTLFDSTERWTEPIIFGEAMFFENPLEIEGHLTGGLYIGCSRNIYLLDDIVYDDADPLTGQTPTTSNNMLLLASEGNIKIANTWANGRNNSNGMGFNQTNRDSTSIVITAALYALGESFTFEQQNDPDSGYVYQDPPGTPHRDDRGTVYLFGSISQWRRGYMHRANGGSTGYLKYWRYDRRFKTRFNPYPFFGERAHGQTTDTLDFGGIPVGHTAWDTAYVYPRRDFCNLGSVLASPPFSAQRIPPFYSDGFAIPVSITPPHTGQFSGVLQVITTCYPSDFQIVLRARALPGGAPPLRLDISPNPFNLTTTLHYTIPQAGAVKITLYDILGRTAKQMDFEKMDAGEHTVQINASDLASGIYFVHLRAGEQTLTRKVFLLK